MSRRRPEMRPSLLNVVGLVTFWCLLWGGLSVKNVLGGLLVALLVVWLFPMPSTGREIALHPIGFVRFLLRFLYDLVVSSIQVGWYAIRPAGQPPSSVIAVQMASRSDLFLTGTGILSTLIPGSVVVEAQRSTGTLFLHVIGAGTEEEVDAAKQRVRDQEERLLRALATRDILEEAGLR